MLPESRTCCRKVVMRIPGGKDASKAVLRVSVRRERIFPTRPLGGYITD